MEPFFAHLLGLRVVAEPRPARALDAESGSVDSLLEAVEAAKVLLDLVVELARRRELAAARRLGGEVLPEESLFPGRTRSVSAWRANAIRSGSRG